MLSIGLTGGIGSGKSEVARLFEQLGVPVVDADVIAHSVVETGSDALAEIVDQFGEQVLTGGGRLDRARLGNIVFNDAAMRKRLEAIIHPRVREQIRSFKQAHRDQPYIIVVIPLLLESSQQDLVDRILVVNADEPVRVQRVQTRDDRDVEQIRAIMETQVDDQARNVAADDRIDNNGSLDDLLRAVERLHRHYLAMAS